MVEKETFIVSAQKKNPNRNGEFIILVDPLPFKENIVTIYDCTPFFHSHKGLTRKQMMSFVKHTVKTDQFTIYIIDEHRKLNQKQATRLGVEWYLGNSITD